MSDKYKVLVVDDEPNILKAIKRLFLGTEYKIITADSGPEGLRAFDEHDIVVVISDYRMPDMNGVDFLRQVRDRSPETIRIVLSGFADTSAMVEAINDGQIYKFIVKPWNDQELLTAIMRAVDQYNLQKEVRELNTVLSRRNESLRYLTESLEEQVEERTRDLQTRNQALQISQNILNLLPIGVLGLDSSGIVVYRNLALSWFHPTSNIGLGLPARGSLEDTLYDSLMQVLADGTPDSFGIGNSPDIGVLGIPLPGGRGVIGLFAASDHIKYFERTIHGILKSEREQGTEEVRAPNPSR